MYDYVESRWAEVRSHYINTRRHDNLEVRQVLNPCLTYTSRYKHVNRGYYQVNLLCYITNILFQPHYEKLDLWQLGSCFYLSILGATMSVCVVWASMGKDYQTVIGMANGT